MNIRYKPQIKDKHSLVDLATYGSKSRQKIHSEVLIGEHPYTPTFKEGDILDANATFNLIQDTYDQEKINKALSKFVDKQETELHELEKKVYDNQEATNEAFGNINRKLDEGLEVVDECKENVNQLDEKVDQFEEEIVDTKSEIIDYYSIPNRFIYDGLEESLLVIR